MSVHLMMMHVTESNAQPFRRFLVYGMLILPFLAVYPSKVFVTFLLEEVFLISYTIISFIVALYQLVQVISVYYSQ